MSETLNKSSALSPTNKFKRFCYLGTLDPVFDERNIENIGNDEPNANLEESILSIKGGEFVNAVNTVLSNKTLIRPDAVWFCYALYMLGQTNDKDKLLVRDAFAQCAKTANDFFLFIKYVKIISNHKHRKMVSKPLRAMIKSWYQARSETDLIDMLCLHKGMHGFTHQNLVQQFHVSPDVFANKKMRNLLFKGLPDVAGSTEAASSKLEKKLTEVCAMRSSENADDVAPVVKRYKLSKDHMTPFHLKSLKVWLELLPNMSYPEIIESSYFLVKNKILKDIHLRVHYIAALGNVTRLKNEPYHPISILLADKLNSKDIKYNGPMAREYFYNKKHLGYQIKNKQNVDLTLLTIYNDSFDYVEKSELRACVTINLKKSLMTKQIANCPYVSCYKAAITMAFAMWKSSEATDIYSYDSASEELCKLEWKKSWSIKEVDEYCTQISKEKIFQRNNLPIKEAMRGGRTYDLFVNIVPSAALGNRNNSSKDLMSQLLEYKKKVNPKAKLITVNLRKLKPTMYHSAASNKSFLEICGCNGNTPKLIKAFAAGHFQ